MACWSLGEGKQSINVTVKTTVSPSFRVGVSIMAIGG